LANHLQQFHFAQVFKKEVPFFWPFFFKPVLQTYQPHSRACNPSYSSPSCIFGGPNTLMSSVSRRKTHNSISSAITCSSVSSIVSLPSLVLMWALLHHCHRLCLHVHSTPYPLLLIFFFFFYFALWCRR
jgi:hypothetical protein